MNAKALLLFLSFFCFFQLEAKPLKVEISSKSAILVNAETGASLFEKQAHLPSYPASITKVATALYALEKISHSLDAYVTASADAVATVSIAERRQSGRHPPYRLEFGGTHIGIRTGEELPLRALFYGLMLASGNDAANVIAEHISGSVPAFMEELNQFLRQIGCLETVFHTPHGMPHLEHKTTAYDMAIIARKALENPFFCEVVQTMSYPRPATNKQPEALIAQHNALLKRGPFYYPKAFGIKTGYSISSGYTLVAAAKDKGRTLIAVLLGCEKLEQRYRDAIALFEAAFAEQLYSRKLFARGFDNFSLLIKGGKKRLEASLLEDLTVEYYPSEEPQFTATVQWSPPPLPLKPGDLVGQVRVVSSDGRVLKTAPLFATAPVESTFGHRCAVTYGQVKEVLSQRSALILALVGLLLLIFSFFVVHKKSAQRKR